MLNNTLVFVAIMVFAITLRLFPGQDHFLWNNNDYARDLYESRQIIKDKDLRLIGARAEVFDHRHNAYLVFTGPLHYYFIGIFYTLGGSNPNFTLLVNILFHMSAAIPLYLLSSKMFKDKWLIFLTLFLWALSYEQVEYARWLLNPAFALPFLIWYFYFLYLLWEKNKVGFLAGLFLGLSAQSEIILLYQLLPLGLILIGKKLGVRELIKTSLGLLIGLLPLVISEIKWQGRATISLIRYVMEGGQQSTSIIDKLINYQDHLSTLITHNITGIIGPTNLLALCLILIIVAVATYRYHKSHWQSFLFLLLILISHLLLYFFNFQPSVYMDIGMGIVMLLLLVLLMAILAHNQMKLLIVLAVFLVMIAQFDLLLTNTYLQTPFSGRFFLSSDVALFSQRLEIVDFMYQQSAGQPFSISILDLPYGHPTLWASIFEHYSRTNGQALPALYGFSVMGVPGDSILTKTDHPRPIHFVIKSPSDFIDDTTRINFDWQQNQVSKLQSTYTINNIQIEIRRKTE